MEGLSWILGSQYRQPPLARHFYKNLGLLSVSFRSKEMQTGDSRTPRTGNPGMEPAGQQALARGSLELCSNDSGKG
jgi:hypothetical protein